MSVKRSVLDNLGYALLGGPVLALASFGVGDAVSGTLAGVGLGLAVWGIGWVLAVRQSGDRDGESGSDPDSGDGESTRERELDARKGSYGGSGGGG